MAASGARLGDLVRAGVKVEIESNLKDPLDALQAFVQTALPKHPGIKEYARHLDENTILHWARLYQVVLPAYGLRLRDGFNWNDVARTFTVVADGVLVRARVRDDHDLEGNSDGEDVLSMVILGLMPKLFEIQPNEIEFRELQHHIVADLGTNIVA